MAANPNQKNWKGISIAIFVIVLILAGVAISVVIKTPPEEEPRVTGRRFKIDDVLDPKFNPPPFNGSWISGKVFMSNKALFTLFCVSFLYFTIVLGKNLVVFMKFDNFIKFIARSMRFFGIICEQIGQFFRATVSL